jgi:PAS domain-containing protein
MSSSKGKNAMAHSRPTGRFSYDTLSGKWEWDDEVFRIHGLEPGSVTPDTELVLASKHPDDRERVARLIEEVSRTGVAFSISYRILLGDGTDRRVVLVGEGQFGAEEQPTRVEGFYIDLTPDFAEENEEYAKQAVAASAQSRAVIEQAKGALMLSYGLDPDQAFAMLRWWSRNRNIKVRDLAERIVVLATEGEATDEGLRRSIDSALHDLTE